MGWPYAEFLLFETFDSSVVNLLQMSLTIHALRRLRGRRKEEPLRSLRKVGYVDRVLGLQGDSKFKHLLSRLLA